MLKIIFLFLSVTVAFGSAEVKWYLPVDLWSDYPIDEYTSYDRISSKDEILFYLNPEFQGKPAAKVVSNIFVDLLSGKECRFESYKFKVKLKDWITCIPYACKEVININPTEVVINDPSNPRWMDSKLNEFSACHYQLGFKIEKEYYHSLILPAGKRETTYISKNLYPDLRFCTKKNMATRCSFNQKPGDNDFSLAYRKEYSKKFKPLSFHIKNKKCLSDISSSECLKELTLTDAELVKFEGDFGYPIKKISWTKENIQELKACLQDGAQIDATLYRGIKKKCFRLIGNDVGKIAVIDYPEAFYSHKEENPQFEFNNYLKP